MEAENELKEQLDRLEAKVDKKIADDASLTELYNKMYAELAVYKKGIYAKLMSPFVNATISLLNDYERIIEKIDTLDTDRLIKYFKGIPDDLESILEDNGVERFTDSPAKFNPKAQRVVRSVPTGDKEADKTVAESIRKGYSWNGVMLKPEMVVIYKYQEGYVDHSSQEEVSGESPSSVEDVVVSKETEVQESEPSQEEAVTSSEGTVTE